MYNLNDIDEDYEVTQNKCEKIARSKLPKQVQALIKLMFDHKEMENTMVKLEVCF
jgi:hypothetical protein